MYKHVPNQGIQWVLNYDVKDYFNFCNVGGSTINKEKCWTFFLDITVKRCLASGTKTMFSDIL